MQNGQIPENRNPDGLKPVDTCYGIYVPAFLPGSGLLDGVHDAVLSGTAMTSYDDMPLGGRTDVVNFLPDALFPDTEPMSPKYDIGNWVLFRTHAEAAGFRGLVAANCIRALEADIETLRTMV